MLITFSCGLSPYEVVLLFLLKEPRISVEGCISVQLFVCDSVKMDVCILIKAVECGPIRFMGALMFFLFDARRR